MDIGQLIRDSRRTAGLSQRELAGRAGTSQPALARYERGRSIPSLATLRRILEATGHELHVSAHPLASPAARSLAEHREQVLAILEHHGVQHARVFGSVARNEETSESDLDLLVEMPNATLVTLADLQAELEDELGVPVDVTTRELLLPEAREKASREAVPL